jgi:A/G-specific adenine glycosylase
MDPMCMTTDEKAWSELRTALLAWYDAHRRDLPWRTAPGERPDPYRIWLSEVMLQQTRVETVRGYYARWLERFPTLEALAAAPQDDVLKAWEGLGYYSRARNFHHAVREVVERYGGEVPAEAETFRALPGVGRYTAGAVASIAFGAPEPVVDGNVRRVFARWLDEPDPHTERLWKLAAEIVPGERPGDLNQALMELGATLCTPRSPRCGDCPVASLCRARSSGTQAERPARKPAQPLPHEDTAVAVVREAGGRVLFTKRKPGTRLAGMWEFPSTIRHPHEEVGEAAARGVHDRFGWTVVAGPTVGEVVHTFSHVRATYRVVPCELAYPGDAGATQGEEVRWLPLVEAGRLALPVAQKRIAALAATAFEPERPTPPGTRR